MLSERPSPKRSALRAEDKLMSRHFTSRVGIQNFIFLISSRLNFSHTCKKPTKCQPLHLLSCARPKICAIQGRLVCSRRWVKQQDHAGMAVGTCTGLCSQLKNLSEGYDVFPLTDAIVQKRGQVCENRTSLCSKTEKFGTFTDHRTPPLAGRVGLHATRECPHHVQLLLHCCWPTQVQVMLGCLFVWLFVFISCTRTMRVV
jgi:hypothetical protein